MGCDQCVRAAHLFIPLQKLKVKILIALIISIRSLPTRKHLHSYVIINIYITSIACNIYVNMLQQKKKQKIFRGRVQLTTVIYLVKLTEVRGSMPQLFHVGLSRAIDALTPFGTELCYCHPSFL